MAFSEAEKVDIRRFCGYPAYTNYGWVGEEDYATLELRMNNMSISEESVIRVTYLPTLDKLETDIPAVADNLETDEAAVWKHNKQERRDRENLFDSWRVRLCGYIGIRTGRGLPSGCKIVRT